MPWLGGPGGPAPAPALTALPPFPAHRAAGGDPRHVPVAAQRPHAAGQHDHEPGYADPQVLDGHPGHQQPDPEQEAHHGLDDPPSVVHSRVAGAHRAGEPRVLGIERLLNLLELALLVLRERHVASR